MSMHTPKIKTQSKQWLEKCKPGPIKAKVFASRTKQIVLVLVHNKGIVYKNSREYRLNWQCLEDVPEGSLPEMPLPGAWGAGVQLRQCSGSHHPGKCRCSSWFPTPFTPMYSHDLTPANLFLSPAQKKNWQA